MVFQNPRSVVGLRCLRWAQVGLTQLCKPQVGGSIPLASSNNLKHFHCFPSPCALGRLRLGCGFGLEKHLFGVMIQAIYRLRIPAWDEMPVEIHGHLNRGMAHLLLDITNSECSLVGL